MGIQNWSDDIILVSLVPEPAMGEELLTAIALAADRKTSDVVIDFADIDIITSSSIAKLLKLRKTLVDCDRRLILSSIRPQTKKIFCVTGLDGVFEFVGDQFLALAGLQMVN